VFFLYTLNQPTRESTERKVSFLFEDQKPKLYIYSHHLTRSKREERMEDMISTSLKRKTREEDYKVNTENAKELIDKIIIYTDGSCIGNPGNGGWAYSIEYFDKSEKSLRKETKSGSEEFTTNNRMELMAVIECLKVISQELCENIVLYTDSKYVKDGITSWIHGWKAKNWKKADKKPVLNKDLWIELDSLVSVKKDFIEWKWVKGHSGDEGNSIVDKLANQAANSFKSQKTTIKE